MSLIMSMSICITTSMSMSINVIVTNNYDRLCEYGYKN